MTDEKIQKHLKEQFTEIGEYYRTHADRFEVWPGSTLEES